MKKLLFACSSLLLALMLFAPGIAEAITEAVIIDPVQVTLDMPNQIVTAPSSGVTMVDFTGTVIVAPNYRMDLASFDEPFNNSQTNFLTGTFNAAFLTFFGGGSGTYTGSIFEINVPAGTPPDLYAYEVMSSNPSIFTVSAFFDGGVVANRPDSTNGVSDVSDTAAFSVLVNAPVNGVPDSGSTLLMLGASVVALGFTQRMFVRAQAMAG
ncbi:MAG: hypothetical protein QOH39_2412 [Verrucomicrobiota bacterium]